MDFKKTIFVLPNLLTAASLFCGMYAITLCIGAEAAEETAYRASLLLFYAFIFDLFDGRVARMTKTQSAFGVEFDSLADLVSFGVAPAVIAYRWSLDGAGILGAIVAFLYVLAGALRLGRFNLHAHKPKAKSTGPDKYMQGLPIPMAAAFVIALLLAERAMGGWPWLTEYGLHLRGEEYPIMLVVMVVLALLMVSTVRFRSFKDLRINALSIALVAVVVGGSAVVGFLYSPKYILIALLLTYVLFGFFEAIFTWPRRWREKRAARETGTKTGE
ncbi:MAG: CDP-diacylglycerol--serine O-phosphatidyltransferase [Proteobacteria bacterium]|jgi:CDP-diacylglycerol--serine O-phosphatidyltransferase|nr:CDP-diacylglycerol--serine O-phosphatidyltransferase [Pseudomonadota bacterium]